MTDQTETARALLWRHHLPEDVIDGALCLHAQELAAVQREAISKTDDPVFYEGEAGWLVSLIEPEADAAPAVPAGQAPATDRAATDADRLHDTILGLEAELARMRDLLRTENERANAAIDREETAEQAAEEHRLALSETLGLGTGAPWDAIHDRARALRSADESAQEGWEQAAIQRSRATAWREGAEQAEAEVERLRIDRAAVLREAADRFDRHASQILDGVGDKAVFVAKPLRYQAAVWSEAAETLRRLATPAVVSAVPGQADSETTFATQVWPLARVLTEVRCGSQDWTWDEEWADLDRRHAETGYLDKLTEDIRTNGITMPVLIGTNGRLWDGHHRLRIAVRLGIGYVPVEVPAVEQPAAGAQAPCAECDHPKAAHTEREDPVSVGQCTACPPDGDTCHDYEPAAGAQQPKEARP